MVRLSDLMAVTELALGPTYVPHPDTQVRWVATSELADPTPYLEGGEVLLTTGLETADWRTQWRPYVERLAAVGVAGLGLASGLTHRAPPRELLAACRDLEVNLFEVPPPTTFVAVSRAAAALLEAERESAARRSLDAQRALTQAALAVDDVTALVDRLASLVGGAAAAVTRDGEVAEGPHGRVADLDLDVVRSEVARIRSQGLRAAASSTARGGTTVVRPIGVRSRPELWLAAFVPGQLTEVDRVSVNTAVSLLSLSLGRRSEERAHDRLLRGRAVELLLAGDQRTARIVLGAASVAASAAPRLPQRVRMLRARGPADVRDDALTDMEGQRLLAATLDDDLVVVAGAQRAVNLADQLAGRGLQVGIGRAVPVDDASASLSTADHALGATTPSVPIRAWEDLARGGVVGLLGTDRAAAFARSYLAPLEDDPVLLETLAAFLRRHGSRGETAAELGVHRNTIRNRVEQIEARLGATLDDPQVRVDAWVALQVGGAPRAL